MTSWAPAICSSRRRLTPASPTLGQDDFLQESLDEVGLAAPGGTVRDLLRLEGEGAPDRAQQAIDRRAFLGAAREVHAAQQRARVDAAAAEHVVDELAEHVLQRRELLREAEDAARGGARRARPRARSNTRSLRRVDQRVELRREELRRVRP